MGIGNTSNDIKANQDASRRSVRVPVRSPVPVDLRRLVNPGALQRLVPKESDFPYAFFYLIAAFVSAWYGGYVPGALACVLTIVGFPLAAIRFSHMLPVDLGRLTLFVGVSLLISRVAQTQRRLREVLQTANGELDLRVQARTSELQSEITDRKLAEQKLRTQIERLNLLDEITRAMGARQDLHSIFQAVVRSLEDSLQIDFAWCVPIRCRPHRAECDLCWIA